MADNIQNSCNKSSQVKNKPRNFKIQRRRKKKILVKRKNNQYFKRKRLLRSLILRKQKLKMSNDDASNSASDHRWHQGDEIAFWKARAVSLEFENKMLHKHIKQMYLNMISYNQQAQQYCENEDESGEILYRKQKSSNKKKSEGNKTNEDSEDEEQSKPPEEQMSEVKEKEMQKLYGSAWRKITGMETAVQLNFDIFVEKTKAKHWPVIPIVFERE